MIVYLVKNYCYTNRGEFHSHDVAVFETKEDAEDFVKNNKDEAEIGLDIFEIDFVTSGFYNNATSNEFPDSIYIK